jgi:hypothetical protein
MDDPFNLDLLPSFAYPAGKELSRVLEVSTMNFQHLVLLMIYYVCLELGDLSLSLVLIQKS